MPACPIRRHALDKLGVVDVDVDVVTVMETPVEVARRSHHLAAGREHQAVFGGDIEAESHRFAGSDGQVERSGRSGFRCGYSNGRFGVNLNSNSKAPDGFHRALLSQVTSRLLGSEDVEIVNVCHHTVVPSA